MLLYTDTGTVCKGVMMGTEMFVNWDQVLFCKALPTRQSEPMCCQISPNETLVNLQSIHL